MLSMNPNAIALLERNQDNIWCWVMLSDNPNAISLLERNQDKIDWCWLCANPAFFVYDYERMRDHMYSSGLKQALMENRFHPRNIMRFRDWGFGGLGADGYESD